MTTVDRVSHALHRAAMYRLCGAALAYPAPGRLADIGALADRIAPSADTEMHTLLTRLAEVAREADDAAVAADYVRLFESPAGCAPYEGAYGLPQMGGKSALLADIAGFYAAFGLEVSQGQADAEDHIASELELMSALALKEAWALAEGHDERADISAGASATFLAEHLARWAPTLAEDLGQMSSQSFYREVAAVVSTWVAADTACLDVHAAVMPRGPMDRENQAFGCPMAPEPAE